MSKKQCEIFKHLLKISKIFIERLFMIFDALALIASELNEYIKKRSHSDDQQHVFLGNIADASGAAASLNDVITITLANIEQEQHNKSQTFQRIQNDKSFYYTQPEIQLNFYIIISIRPGKDQQENNNSYVNALKRLSMVAYFFQSNPFLDQSSIQNPKVSNDLGRLTIELYTAGFEHLSYIWGIQGGHYLPSLIYKVRLITIQEGIVAKEVPVVETVDLNSGRGGL